MTDNGETKANQKVIIPIISVEAERLYERLSTMQPGEFISYVEMSRITSLNIQKKTGIRYTAERKAFREHGFVFVTDRGNGIKRAENRDYLGIVHNGVTRSRRIVKKSLKRSLAMPQEEFAGLSNEDKVMLNTSRTICATVAHFSGPGITKKLESAVKAENDRLTIGRVLDITKKDNEA